MKIQAAIFDLDGVIVDTARFHFLAWKKLADELGIPFSHEENERLKGVSRMTSLDIILSLGNPAPVLSDEQKKELADRKNAWYVELIATLTPDDILPGVSEFILECRKAGIKTAIASASKNARPILTSLELIELFDSIVDGTRISKAKPDPEVFLQASLDVNKTPGECVVFEDAAAGIEGAIAAGMFCVGIGEPGILGKANIVIPGFRNFHLADLQMESAAV